MTSNTDNPARQGKLYDSAPDAFHGLADGMSVLIAGYAACGLPHKLLQALADSGVGDLTLVCQGAWPHEDGVFGINDLVATGQVGKMISPLPFHPEHGGAIKEKWEAGTLELEIVPQGVLAERLRAGGAGVGGVFIPTGAGTRFSEGKEIRQFDGRDHVLEVALKADFALLRAQATDQLGNMVYQGTGRNWNPTMAMAAAVTIAEVDQVHEPGGLDPELVITQAIFIDRLVLSGQG